MLLCILFNFILNMFFILDYNSDKTGSLWELFLDPEEG